MILWVGVDVLVLKIFFCKELKHSSHDSFHPHLKLFAPQWHMGLKGRMRNNNHMEQQGWPHVRFNPTTIMKNSTSSHYLLHLKSGHSHKGSSLHTKEDGHFVLCSLQEFSKGRTLHKVEFHLSEILSLHLVVALHSQWNKEKQVNIPPQTHSFKII